MCVYMKTCMYMMNGIFLLFDYLSSSTLAFFKLVTKLSKTHAFSRNSSICKKWWRKRGVVFEVKPIYMFIHKHVYSNIQVIQVFCFYKQVFFLCPYFQQRFDQCWQKTKRKKNKTKKLRKILPWAQMEYRIDETDNSLFLKKSFKNLANSCYAYPRYIQSKIFQNCHIVPNPEWNLKDILDHRNRKTKTRSNIIITNYQPA